MNASHQEWTDRFSDYLAGELDEETTARVEGHLAECGGCRAVLAELRDVVARAGGLEEIHPPRDLWRGIAAAIGSPVRAQGGDAQVIALSTFERAPSARSGGDRGRIALTRVQLAAAAVILVALSASATWWAGPGVASRAPGVASPPPAGAVAMATDVAEPPEALSSELSDLESVLEAARAELDPNTVRVIERNLAVIEQAIVDSRRALALDPGNEFLEHHLTRTYERKLEYLRDAARVIDWAG
jgi:anti-sigma factor RsiW